MPEYLAPGVYVEELPSGNMQIEGVSTNTAGFVGATERGPLAPQFITSWTEFQQWYGGVVEGSFLPQAVEGFFINGGQRCFVARAADAVGVDAPDRYAQKLLPDGLQVVAIGPGAWGNRLSIGVTAASQAEHAKDDDDARNWVNVSIFLGDERVEVFENLSLKSNALNQLVGVINAESRFVRVWWPEGTTVPATLTKTVVKIKLEGGTSSALPLTKLDAYIGHADAVTVEGLTLPADGSEGLGRGQGLRTLEQIDEIALLVAPDQARDALYEGLAEAVIEQCERLQDRFAIISSKAGQSAVNDLVPPQDSSFAGFYYPWIKVLDASTNDTVAMPASGHIAGIFARTDLEHGVHKAPANEAVVGAVGLEFPVTSAMQDVLNPRGVNCIRDFRSDGRGLLVWGARTMSSNPDWRYVNVRRLFLFLEESIKKGLQWVVFEANDEATWASVGRTVTTFLTSVWSDGALMGTTPDEAFFVRCDGTTMTQVDIDNGRLVCAIGIAPVQPAEFVIFNVVQDTAEVPASDRQ